MIGFGLQPMGISMVGVGATVPADVPGVPGTGLRYLNNHGELEIDPVTQDVRRMPATRNRVMLAIRTLYGTAGADRDLGVQWPPDITGPDDPRVRAAVELALAFLINAKQIELLDVTWGISDVQGRLWAEVSFVDLATGLADSVRTVR